jgi:hypothetical protein
VPKRDRLLERLRGARTCRPNDLRALYLAWGFTLEEGAKHSKYHHPDHPELYQTVPRADPLSARYAEDAVELVEQLQRIEGGA